MAPWPEPPPVVETIVLQDPRNQWVLQGETVSGDYLYIREPVAGVRCFSFAMATGYSSGQLSEYAVGCVPIPTSVPGEVIPHG
jgi:hypothetical protein